MLFPRRQPKEKKRLVVHLGLRKVATTSIQVHLQANASILKEQHDVLVLSRHEMFNPWREIVYAFMNNKISKKRYLKKIECEARKVSRWMLKQPEGIILISDENLFGARLYREEAEGNTVTTLFDWASWLLPRVADIWNKVFHLTFVLYLRPDESDWLRSCYNQEVKNNRVVLTFEEWIAKVPQYGWNEKFRLLSEKLEVPLRTVFLGQESQLSSTLLQQVGVDCTESHLSKPSQERLNESLPEAALEFMRAINQHPGISFASKSAVGAVVDSMRHLFWTGAIPKE